MTLIDALKTGRRIRNKDFNSFCEWFEYSKWTTFYDKDILSDAWEVEPEVIEFESVVREGFDKSSVYIVNCNLKNFVHKKVRVRVEVIE